MHGTLVVQGAGAPPVTTTRTLTVTPSAVTVVSTASVQGAGFTPRSLVFVFLQRPDGSRAGIWIATSSSGMCSFVLGFAPRHGVGTERVAAFDRGAGTWTPLSSITVLAHGVGTGALSASINPVHIGATTIISGRGFTPGTVAVVQWHRPDGTMTAIRIRTDGMGTFAFQLLADPRHG
jgi:hypothetical protein